MTAKYKQILDEMQIKLARDTLSKCIVDVDGMMKTILPKNGNRRQRMSHFLRFILQDDHNVIEFEKVLRQNGLDELLLIEGNVNGDDMATKDIGRLQVNYNIMYHSRLLFLVILYKWYF